MKPNAYGAFVRAIRKQNGETLADMSAKLGVSIAFLSALETGQKIVPLFYIDKIADAYGLNAEEKEELANTVDISNSRIIIQLADLDSERVSVALKLARTIETMPEEKVEALKKVLF